MKSLIRCASITLVASIVLLNGCVDDQAEPPAADSSETAGRPASPAVIGGRTSPDEPLGGAPAPMDPDCGQDAAPDPKDQCPIDSFYFGEGNCDDVPEESFEGCVVVTFDAGCGQISTAVCLTHEPDESDEVCDDYDNDRDGLIDEDANCPQLEETCGPHDEDNDGKVDEGLECSVVDRVEAKYPCDSPNAYDGHRRREICPEGYGYVESECGDIAASRVSDESCIEVEETVCGRDVAVHCVIFHFAVDGTEAVQSQKTPLRCEGAANAPLTADELCDLAGLEQVTEQYSPRCWMGEPNCPSCPPRRTEACINVDYCDNAERRSVICALPQ